MTNLITPDTSIVSLDEARKEKENVARVPKKGMKDYVTREEMMAAVGKAALALGQKMYDQVSEELAENLEDFRADVNRVIHAKIAQVVYEEMEARTIRGRLRALWRRWHLPSVAPELMSARERLDAKDAAAAELRRRITAAPDGAQVEVPDGLTEEEALEIARQIHEEVRETVETVLERPVHP